MVQLSHPYMTTGKTIALAIQTFVNKVISLFFNTLSRFIMGFPGGSEVKASASNAGDPGSFPGSGRYPGEGNGNPLQYSCLENPMDGGAWRATVHGSQRVGHDCATSLHFHSQVCHSFASKEQTYFNFMAAITVPSGFGAQDNEMSVLPLFPLLFAMRWWNWMPWS